MLDRVRILTGYASLLTLDQVGLHNRVQVPMFELAVALKFSSCTVCCPDSVIPELLRTITMLTSWRRNEMKEMKNYKQEQNKVLFKVFFFTKLFIKRHKVI